MLLRILLLIFFVSPSATYADDNHKKLTKNAISISDVINRFPICTIQSSIGQICKSLSIKERQHYSFANFNNYEQKYVNNTKGAVFNEDWRYVLDILETEDKTQLILMDEALTATYYTVVTYDIEFSETERNWFLIGSVVDDLRGSEDDRKVIGQYRKYNPPIPFLEINE